MLSLLSSTSPTWAWNPTLRKVGIGVGMAAPTRTSVQREKDRAETAALYLQGWYQVDIAKRVGISQQMVSYDLKVLQKRWQKSALVDIDKAKGQELAKVDRLEREYWAAWIKSKEKGVRAKTTTQRDGKTVSVAREADNREGDPRFLAGVQWCIERRCKIIGIDAPKRQQITGAEGEPLLPVGALVAALLAADKVLADDQS